jgi:hypothetical protein
MYFELMIQGQARYQVKKQPENKLNTRQIIQQENGLGEVNHYI